MAISNFYSSPCVAAGFFDSNSDNYTGNLPECPSDYAPDTEWTPILFDQSDLVAGSFGSDRWGTLPRLDGFDDSLKIVTYDDARL